MGASTNAERVHFTGHGISEISRYRLSLSIDVPSPPSPLLPLATPTTTSLSPSLGHGVRDFREESSGETRAARCGLRRDVRTRFSRDQGNSPTPFSNKGIRTFRKRMERLVDGDNNRLVSYTGRRQIIGHDGSDLIPLPPPWTIFSPRERKREREEKENPCEIRRNNGKSSRSRMRRGGGLLPASVAPRQLRALLYYWRRVIVSH